MGSGIDNLAIEAYTLLEGSENAGVFRDGQRYTFAEIVNIRRLIEVYKKTPIDSVYFDIGNEKRLYITRDKYNGHSIEKGVMTIKHAKGKGDLRVINLNQVKTSKLAQKV